MTAARVFKNPTLQEVLKRGVRYVVHKGTRCRTLQRGDHIAQDGLGLSSSGEGLRRWMPPGSWEKFRCPVSVDRDWYKLRIETMRKDIAAFTKILKENP